MYNLKIIKIRDLFLAATLCGGLGACATPEQSDKPVLLEAATKPLVNSEECYRGIAVESLYQIGDEQKTVTSTASDLSPEAVDWIKRCKTRQDRLFAIAADTPILIQALRSPGVSKTQKDAIVTTIVANLRDEDPDIRFTQTQALSATGVQIVVAPVNTPGPANENEATVDVRVIAEPAEGPNANKNTIKTGNGELWYIPGMTFDSPS